MHLLMVRQLKSRPETRHKFPLLSDVGLLLTCNTLIDQVLQMQCADEYKPLAAAHGKLCRHPRQKGADVWVVSGC